MLRFLGAAVLAASWMCGPAWAQPALGIVAAESVYGDIAKQVGGALVTVSSILTNPDQDPHLFEASPSVARAVSAARIVITNGADYDPWARKLLAVGRHPGRAVIVVADLAGRKSGDNPHVWYDPAAGLGLARALATALSAADPAHQADYERNRAGFERSMQPILARAAAMRTRFAGTPVTATEPVFGYMFDALGMSVRNKGFQLAVMNDTEPSASDVAAFESDLRMHKVRLLVYNSQATSPVAARMRAVAEASHVPVVGTTETEPAGASYQGWMMTELDAVEMALRE